MIQSSLAFEILLILLLILANGLFSMSEIAVVSARKVRLRERADAGDAGARRALELAEHPTRFLSTVQIGITLVGVFTGAYGGASIAGQLDGYLEHFPGIAPYSEELALGIVVAILTFLSLVIGELVPKSVALTDPERIASWVAGPMGTVSTLAAPLVKLLSLTTDGVLRLLRVRKPEEPAVTEGELAALLEAGAEAGVLEEEEHELVERIFWLGDQRASALMTPRHRIAWLDAADPPEKHRAEMVLHRYSHYLVCEGDVDHPLGMVRVKDVLAELLEGKPLDVQAVLRKPLFVPESLAAFRLLELFRESGTHLAVVIDEYGGVDGIVTLDDVLREITGNLAVEAEPRLHRREDGSWLLDGALSMEEVLEALEMEERRGGERSEYHTLAGFVVTQLGRIPTSGESFRWRGMTFEVMDMDGRRVDKVLVAPATPGAAHPPDSGY